MASRPKRSISRVNYCTLADVELPRTRKTKNSVAKRDSNKLYRLKIIDSDESAGRVKVRYIGYGEDYDKWRLLEDIDPLQRALVRLLIT